LPDGFNVETTPGRKLELPSKRLRRPCGRFYSLDEIRRLLSAAAAGSLREHLIVRLFVIGGLRAQEMFELRVDDIEPGILRTDEALKETEKGAARVGETKSTTSNGYIAISPELEGELRTCLQIRNVADPYHRVVGTPNDLLFPTEAGTPYRIGNYLKRVLKPIAKEAGIPDPPTRLCVERLRLTSNGTVPRRTLRRSYAIQSSK
jgi:integrase